MVASVAGRTGVLLFDNCEHVVDAAADLVKALATGAEVTALTSREPLGVPGETSGPLGGRPVLLRRRLRQAVAADPLPGRA